MLFIDCVMVCIKSRRADSHCNTEHALFWKTAFAKALQQKSEHFVAMQQCGGIYRFDLYTPVQQVSHCYDIQYSHFVKLAIILNGKNMQLILFSHLF